MVLNKPDESESMNNPENLNYLLMLYCIFLRCSTNVLFIKQVLKIFSFENPNQVSLLGRTILKLL